MVLHTWGSALTHHPHVHCIVPGGGFSTDGQQWVKCKPGFFLSVRVLSRLFRRLFLEKLSDAYKTEQLRFYGRQALLLETQQFTRLINISRKVEWVVYAKRPFAGPKAVLAYLSRYTHRVAIANSRLLGFDSQGVTFKWKDYRRKGENQHKTMILDTGEFIRRFLIHILPSGFHRIRHYGLLANAKRVDNLVQARELLAVPVPESTNEATDNDDSPVSTYICRSCGAPMIIVETLDSSHRPRAPPNGIAA
jgi:hypothetical protein